MKKLLFLLAVPIYVFTMTSCNGDESKKETTDSNKTDTVNDTTKKIPLTPPPIDISFYRLPAGMGFKMKEWKDKCPSGERQTPTTIDEIPNVLDAIKDNYKDSSCTAETLNVRFKDKDDEDFYCKINHFESKPEKCKVKNYKIWIYHVTCTSTNKLASTDTYYELVTICPPPKGGCQKKDSTESN